MYGNDYDGLFPYGGDPTDTQTNDWQFAQGGKFGPKRTILRSCQSFCSLMLNQQNLGIALPIQVLMP